MSSRFSLLKLSNALCATQENGYQGSPGRRHIFECTTWDRSSLVVAVRPESLRRMMGRRGKPLLRTAKSSRHKRTTLCRTRIPAELVQGQCLQKVDKTNKPTMPRDITSIVTSSVVERRSTLFSSNASASFTAVSKASLIDADYHGLRNQGGRPANAFVRSLNIA